MNALEHLLIEAKKLISSGKLENQIKKIKDDYEEFHESGVSITFEHIFSSSDFMKFENAVWESKEDKTDSFQDYIHKVMGKKNLTKVILSDRSGIEQSTLNRYINGNRRLTVDTVFRIALALRLNLIETETLLRKANMSFKKSPKDAVVIEAIKQRNFDYLAVEAVLWNLTNGEESILTKKERMEFSDEDWEIEIAD